jgi:hypothetical protein
MDALAPVHSMVPRHFPAIGCPTAVYAKLNAVVISRGI